MPWRKQGACHFLEFMCWQCKKLVQRRLPCFWLYSLHLVRKGVNWPHLLQICASAIGPCSFVTSSHSLSSQNQDIISCSQVCQFSHLCYSSLAFFKLRFSWASIIVVVGKSLSLSLSFFFLLLGPHPWHMEVPRLGVELELQLLAYTTATALWDLSCICDPHHSSWQCRILSLLSEARDWTCILMDPTWVH